MFEIKFGIVSDYAFGGDKGKFSVINIFDKIKLGTYNNFTIRNFYVSFRFNIEQGTHNFKLAKFILWTILNHKMKIKEFK